MLKDQKIPATVITGFLGAGKTTVIQNILQNAKGKRIALIINEFGDLGIDGEVLKSCGNSACTDEDIVELANGCICCTVADDFIPTMTQLIDRANPPHHIIIETSGLALPQPLVRAFSWPEIRSRVTVDGVITIVDSAAVSEGHHATDEAAIQAQREADESLDHETPIEELFEDQLICADLVLLNKADLLDGQTIEKVENQLRTDVRPGVQFIRTQNGKIGTEILLGLEAGAENDMDLRKSHHENHHDGSDHDHNHDDFESFCVAFDKISDSDAFLQKIKKTITDHRILRMKGFIALQDKDMRYVIQAVGPRINSYFDRPWNKDEKRLSSLVVIGETGMDENAIRLALTG